MKHEIRHPYQILDIDELVIGQTYAFISIDFNGLLVSTYYTLSGIIKDSGDVDETANITTFVTLPDITKGIITIHLDGWNPCKNLVRKLGHSVIVYWNESTGCGWAYDWLDTYISQKKTQSEGSIVVLKQHWQDDPQVYPNAIERKIKSEEVLDAKGWEQRMRQKKHDAMAKMLGF